MNDTPPKRVLLADDNRVLVTMLTRYLVSQGYEVKCVEGASGAIRALESSTFDVVLADIYMPGNENFELLRVLEKEYASLPVIVMTGNPSVATAVTAFRGTAVDYLAKPFGLEDVAAAIESALRVGARRASVNKMRELAASMLNEERVVEEAREDQNKRTLMAKLTSRERDVVDKFAEGKRPDDVAESLSISPHTVRSHLKSIYRKLEVNSQVELLNKLGLIGR